MFTLITLDEAIKEKPKMRESNGEYKVYPPITKDEESEQHQIVTHTQNDSIIQKMV